MYNGSSYPTVVKYINHAFLKTSVQRQVPDMDTACYRKFKLGAEPAGGTMERLMKPGLAGGPLIFLEGGVN